MKPFSALLAAAFLAALVAALPARAITDQEELVETARFTVEKLISHADLGGAVRTMLKDAKGVLVIPSLLKGAFFFGAEGGSGVLMARGDGGKWSYPAFFTIGSASFGLQFGGQAAEVMLVLMTNKGLNAVLNHKVKIGGDISAAIGPYGLGAEASTTSNMGADILSYSVAKGAFVGFSFEGAVIYPRDEWTTGYYGDENATPKAVVLDGRYRNAQAEKLRSALAAVR